MWSDLSAAFWFSATMTQEKKLVPDLNQDVYRKILKVIVRRKHNALSEIMNEYAG